MDNFQKLLLLVLVSSTTCLSNSIERRLAQQYTSKAINFTTPDESDCFCFQKSPSSILIQNVLQVPGHDLERLVVYFYRDTVTKEINAFTPGLEKQRIIPDLRSDTNDVILRVSTETVDHIFMNSPWFTLPKQLNSSTQVTTYETNGILLPPNKNNDNKYVDVHYVSPINNQDNDASHLIPVQYELSDANEPNKPTNVNEDKELEPCSQYDPANPVGVTESCGDKQLLNWHDSGAAIVTDIDLANDGKYHTNFYITFDKWLDEQMKLVEMKPTEINSIDIIELKRRIEVTLQENGIFVSSDGIVDKNGRILDMANFKLRPIYIGESVDFRNMANEKTNIKLKLPVNLQYLESILVTLIEPPRLLGIIPFRKVFLPTQYTEMQLNDHNTTNKIDKLKVLFPKKVIKSGYVTKNKQNTGQPRYSKYFKTFNLISNDNIHEFPEHEKIKKLLDDKHDDSLLSDTEHRWDRLFETTETDRNGRKSLKDTIKEPEVLAAKLKGMLKTLLELAKTKEIKGEDGRDEESESEEHDLGFRIIGGNAATSSGYPLQYKGRSGFIE